jgi:proteasome lid subunit RPN8/RPN11
LKVPRALWDEIVAHALADSNEVCGMVAGRDGVATRVLPVVNKAASPRHYEMDPLDQHRVHTEIEDAGEELLAIYHSHPPTSAYFSDTDLERAFLGEHLAWPGVLYIVVGLQPLGVKTFEIAEDRTVTEIELDVVQ